MTTAFMIRSIAQNGSTGTAVVLFLSLILGLALGFAAPPELHVSSKPRRNASRYTTPCLPYIRGPSYDEWPFIWTFLRNRRMGVCVGHFGLEQFRVLDDRLVPTDTY